MSNDENPIKSFLPEKVLEKFYDDALSGPAQQLGALGTDVAKVVRLFLLPIRIGAAYHDRLEKMFQRIAQKVPEEQRTSPPPELVGPALEGMNYLDDSGVLWQMFEELMTKSIDKDDIKSLHPAFPKILSQLSRDEAVILYLLSKSDFNVVDYMDFNRPENRFENRRIESSNLPRDELFVPENIELYYSHLESLNLVAWPVLSQDPIKDSSGIQIGLHRKSRMCLTEFGRFFIEAVIPKNGLQLH